MKNTTKRRTLLALVSLLIVACMTLLALPISADTTEPTDTWDGTTDTEFDGKGTKAEPYQITSAEELAGLAVLVRGSSNTNYNAKYYELKTNVDLNNRPWTPIGGGGKVVKVKFDGGNFTVSNLSISGQGVHTGLFSNLNVGAEIKNLCVKNATLNGSECGGIAGIGSGGLFENCHVSGVTFSLSSNSRAGGIIARYSGNDNLTIRDCTVNINNTFSDATATVNMGGIIGASGINDNDSKLYIEDCTVTLGVTHATAEKGANIGGIIAYNDMSTVTDNKSVSKDEVTVKNCIVNLTATAETGTTVTPNIGGIIGFSATPSTYTADDFGAKINVEGCTVRGTVNTNNAKIVAGIVTQAFGDVTVSNCSTDLDVIATGNTATDGCLSGLVGYVNHGDVSISGCNVAGDITLTNEANQIYAANAIARHAGDKTKALTVENCVATGDISVESTSTVIAYIGGIVGYEKDNSLTIKNCVSTSDISLTGAKGAVEMGGIIGASSGTATGIGQTSSNSEGYSIQRLIENCTYAGNIVGGSDSTSNNVVYFGGIAGRFQNFPEIRNTSMYGTVSFKFSSDTATFRAGLFAGAYAYGGLDAVIKDSICATPAGTVLGNTSDDTIDDRTYTVGSETFVKLDVIGGAAKLGSVDIEIISPSTADIAMSLTGIQTSENPFDYDHDKNSETPTVKATDIRFVAALGDSESDDDADLLSRYSAVGFVITATYGTKVFDFSQDVNHVYESILAKGESVAASVYGGDYLVTITGRNIPASETDTVTFYVTPKLTTINGDAVYGATTALTFVGGVYQGGN